MKKLLLILTKNSTMKKLTFISFFLFYVSVFSYASFPVNEIDNIKITNKVEFQDESNNGTNWVVLSIIFIIVSFLFIGRNFGLVFLSSLLSLIFGILGLKKKKKKNVFAMIGFTLALLFFLFLLFLIIYIISNGPFIG